MPLIADYTIMLVGVRASRLHNRHSIFAGTSGRPQSNAAYVSLSFPNYCPRSGIPCTGNLWCKMAWPPAQPQLCDVVTRLGNYKGTLPSFHLLTVSSQVV